MEWRNQLSLCCICGHCPEDPLYAGDVEQVFRQAREDLIALQDGGVDGVLIANEFSLPYQPQAEPVTVGARAIWLAG